jgi:hypothetical protein
MATKKKSTKRPAKKGSAKVSLKGLAALPHKDRFKKIAQSCQLEVTAGGKSRAKEVGKCMKREFKALKDA